MIESYVIFLLFLMIIGGIISIEGKNLFTSVISLGVVGYSLTILFFLLNAPDLAIVLAIIESLTLVIFLITISKTQNIDIKSRFDLKRVIHYTFLIIIAFVFTERLLPILEELPPFGEPIMRMSNKYIELSAQTGSKNIVTSILFDFRGYDTLGEISILFSAIIGIMLILRDNHVNNSKNNR